MCSCEAFAAWAGDSISLRMEFFYRQMRREHNVLMKDGEPVGGQWNFDSDNRRSFGKAGPGFRPQPPVFNCLRQCITQTLDYGYAHHIQRLMITGMFGVTAEIEPQQLGDWYLAVYVDAVEWVELPNTAGMALFANSGRFTSKPYIASGAHVKRMSNYCEGCAYKPEVKTGAAACPMTTLYWTFLDKHERAFSANLRTSLMIKNLQRLDAAERVAIRSEGERMLANLNGL
jgi:deoxyribodipyrimidine photolyase-related protein